MDITVPQLQNCLFTPGWNRPSDTSFELDCALSWDPDSSSAGWDTTVWLTPEPGSSVLADRTHLTSDSDCLTDSTSYSLSPISSVDSYRLSPLRLPGSSPPDACADASLPSPSGGRRAVGRRPRKARSCFPGRQRQSASEREKLRMRGLAKALHNLRTYLPPSVAPAAQSLTKLETLRLTIRYIAYLTELLNEEPPSAARDTEAACRVRCPQGLGCCQSWLHHSVHLPSPSLPTSHQPESQDQNTFLQGFHSEPGSTQAPQFPQNYIPGF